MAKLERRLVFNLDTALLLRNQSLLVTKGPLREVFVVHGCQSGWKSITYPSVTHGLTNVTVNLRPANPKLPILPKGDLS